MPGQKVRNFLDSHGIKYVTVMHSPAYTAQGIAESAHISGKNIAKCVILKVDGRMAMAVTAADFRVSTDLLRDILSADSVELATESEFKDTFPDCEIGAMPPFGNLYEMKVYVSLEIDQDEEIAFNAGTHTELIQMSYKDFKKLVRPKVLDFSVK